MSGLGILIYQTNFLFSCISLISTIEDQLKEEHYVRHLLHNHDNI